MYYKHAGYNLWNSLYNDHMKVRVNPNTITNILLRGLAIFFFFQAASLMLAIISFTPTD